MSTSRCQNAGCEIADEPAQGETRWREKRDEEAYDRNRRKHTSQIDNLTLNNTSDYGTQGKWSEGLPGRAAATAAVDDVYLGPQVPAASSGLSSGNGGAKHREPPRHKATKQAGAPPAEAVPFLGPAGGGMSLRPCSGSRDTAPGAAGASVWAGGAGGFGRSEPAKMQVNQRARGQRGEGRRPNRRVMREKFHKYGRRSPQSRREVSGRGRVIGDALSSEVYEQFDRLPGRQVHSSLDVVPSDPLLDEEEAEQEETRSLPGLQVTHRARNVDDPAHSAASTPSPSFSSHLYGVGRTSSLSTQSSYSGFQSSDEQILGSHESLEREIDRISQSVAEGPSPEVPLDGGSWDCLDEDAPAAYAPLLAPSPPVTEPVRLSVPEMQPMLFQPWVPLGARPPSPMAHTRAALPSAPMPAAGAVRPTPQRAAAALDAQRPHERAPEAGRSIGAPASHHAASKPPTGASVGARSAAAHSGVPARNPSASGIPNARRNVPGVGAERRGRNASMYTPPRAHVVPTLSRLRTYSGAEMHEAQSSVDRITSLRQHNSSQGREGSSADSFLAHVESSVRHARQPPAACHPSVKRDMRRTLSGEQGALHASHAASAHANDHQLPPTGPRVSERAETAAKMSQVAFDTASADVGDALLRDRDE